MSATHPQNAIIERLAATAPDRPALWASLVRELGVRRIAEVGVWRGEFAEHLLRSCPDIEHYTLIDPWRNLSDWNKPANTDQGRFDAIYAEALSRLEFAADRLEVHRARTLDCADAIDDGSLDFIYIDGDHTLRGITIDLELMLGKCRRGGFVGGDDFARQRQHGPRFEPTLVCPYAIYFAEARRLPIWCLPYSQFLILNDASHGFQLIDCVGGYRGIDVNAVTRVDLKHRLVGALRWLRGSGWS